MEELDWTKDRTRGLIRPMTRHVLLSWQLTVCEFINIFNDAEYLEHGSEDFGPGRSLYTFKDAVGNSAFAVAYRGKIDSHGSVLLNEDTVRRISEVTCQP